MRPTTNIMKAMKTKKLPIIVISVTAVIVVLFLLLAVPFFKVDALTSKYGDEFADGYLATGFFDENECDYYKVIKYKGTGIRLYCSGPGNREWISSVTDSQALVLYVLDGHSCVILITFEENGSGSWKMQSWDCVWSREGSADELTWPLYR